MMLQFPWADITQTELRPLEPGAIGDLPQLLYQETHKTKTICVFPDTFAQVRKRKSERAPGSRAKEHCITYSHVLYITISIIAA